eukprot:jgi/Mesvir1/27466/Mv07244-RA.1
MLSSGTVAAMTVQSKFTSAMPAHVAVQLPVHRAVVARGMQPRRRPFTRPRKLLSAEKLGASSQRSLFDKPLPAWAFPTVLPKTLDAPVPRGQPGNARVEPPSSTTSSRLATLAGSSLLAAILASGLAAEPSLASTAMEVNGTFGEGFASAFLLILLSEIGDKTFFIAVLLALRQSRLQVFIGTFGALTIMTVISVLIGRVFHTLDEALPFSSNIPFDDWAAAALLVVFGVKTLLDASSADESAEEEEREAEEEVEKLTSTASAGIILATFSVVFLAEWGDKSFLATIALAASSSPTGVITGALAGHGLATIIAVLGGSLLSEFVSEKVLAYIGGTMFLVFAAITVIDILMQNPATAAVL